MEQREDEPLTLRIFLDHSLSETFANGRACHISRVYPTPEDCLNIGLFAVDGGVRVESVDVWQMRPTHSKRKAAMQVVRTILAAGVAVSAAAAGASARAAEAPQAATANRWQSHGPVTVSAYLPSPWMTRNPPGHRPIFCVSTLMIQAYDKAIGSRRPESGVAPLGTVLDHDRTSPAPAR